MKIGLSATDGNAPEIDRKHRTTQSADRACWAARSGPSPRRSRPADGPNRATAAIEPVRAGTRDHAASPFGLPEAVDGFTQGCVCPLPSPEGPPRPSGSARPGPTVVPTDPDRRRSRPARGEGFDPDSPTRRRPVSVRARSPADPPGADPRSGPDPARGDVGRWSGRIG